MSGIPEIQLDPAVRTILPDIKLGILSAEIHVRDSSPEIKDLMARVSTDLKIKLTTDDVSFIPSITQTKIAYRLLGKDPSRYRPSAEALCRRITGGKELFQVNNIVDLLNVISIHSGFSIGGYDQNKITGTVWLTRGNENEKYEGIGRGELNIQNLPVLKDNLGVFGSPTSDSTRTMITSATRNFLMVLFDFSGEGDLQKILEQSVEWYDQYSGARNIETGILSF